MKVHVEIGDWRRVDRYGGMRGFRWGGDVGEESEDNVCGGGIVEEEGGRVAGGGGRRGTMAVLVYVEE